MGVMRGLTARDLRSLDRRSMYSIFSPLDDHEPLSRELRAEDESNPTEAGRLAVWGFVKRRRPRPRQPDDEAWVPAMFMFVRRFS